MKNFRNNKKEFIHSFAFLRIMKFSAKKKFTIKEEKKLQEFDAPVIGFLLKEATHDYSLDNILVRLIAWLFDCLLALLIDRLIRYPRTGNLRALRRSQSVARFHLNPFLDERNEYEDQEWDLELTNLDRSPDILFRIGWILG